MGATAFPLIFAVAMSTMDVLSQNQIYQKPVVHIDVRGSDASGVADGSAERPFRTLSGWLAGGGKTDSVSGITFGPGVHDLVGSGGLVLASAGTADNPFVVSGAGAGVTQLSAAVQVRRFTETGAGAARRWTTTLPSNVSYFRQLFVRSAPSGNFSRRLTARSATMAYNHTDMSNPQFAIVYKEGQVLPSYHNQEDVLATLYHCWTATTHLINNISPQNTTLTLYKSPHLNIPRCEHASGKRFLIEDAKEELDEPGEFYYDRQTRELTYLPLLHEQLDSFEAWAPQLITPMLIRADHVVVKDLSLLHAAADMDGFFQGDCDGQSASNLHTGAIALNCTSNKSSSPSIDATVSGNSVESLHSACVDVTVENVEVAHTGGFGVITQGPVSGITLRRLHIHDIGAGGVNLMRTTHPSSVFNVSLQDSVIHDGGHIYRMGPGVMLQSCHSCAVLHNHIYNFFYTGITTGYGFADNMIRDTVLGFNRIHTLGQKVLSDMGCIYVWGGNQSGLLVDHNLCYNVSSYSYGGWGIYNDQTTSHVTHTNNIVYGTEDAAYHDHEGFNVTLHNNILVKSGLTTAGHSDGVLRSAVPHPQKGWYAAFVMRGNIIASTGPTPLFSPGQAAQWALSRFDDNVYWQAGDSDARLFPCNKSLGEWQRDGVSGGKLGGQDKHSCVADPKFKNAAAHDYTLLPSSPALAHGFTQIDASTVGPRSLDL